VQNTKISEMHNLLTQGRDMDYIASHYHMDLALARPPRLKAKPTPLPCVAKHRERSGEAGGEEDNVPSIKRVLRE